MLDDSVDALRSVLHERVQQRTAKQIGDECLRAWPKWHLRRGIVSDTTRLKRISIRWKFKLCVFSFQRRRFASPDT